MKARFLALAALVLGLASCQTEPEGLDVNVGGAVDTTITVSLPETTRANSAEGAFANVDFNDYTIRYILQVYYKGEPSKERLVKYSDGKSVVFPVRLVPGRDYSFVVWADLVNEGNYTENVWSNEDGLHYNTTDLHNITLKKTWVAMDETRDAYTDVETLTYNGNTAINLELIRPFAKLRVVTTDMVALNNLGIMPTKATVEYTVDHYNAFNALAGSVIGDSKNRDIKHEKFAIKSYGEDVQHGADMTLFTDYFFAKAGDVVKFEFNVYDQNNDLIKFNNFNTDIAVNRNYLTTIQGNVLTDCNNVKVTVVEDGQFAGEKVEKIVEVNNAAEFQDAIGNAVAGEDTVIVLGDDINLNDLISTLSTRATSTALTIANGKTISIDLNGKTLSATSTQSGGHQELFLVKGNLSIVNGNIQYEHVGENMGWGYMTTIFDVTAGGVLNLEGVTAKNLGGSDMNFVAHLNNWGEVTLNVENCTLEATYVPVRVFNSGYNMNNVTIKNSTLKGVSAAFWVHNYTEADFANDANTTAEKQKSLLNFDILDQSNTFSPIVGIRYGFTNSIRFDSYGIARTVSEDGTIVTLDKFFGEGVVRRGVAGAEKNSDVKKVVVNEGITSLVDRTFYRYFALETVELPSTLKVLGANGDDYYTNGNVFQGCAALKNIVIPESVTTMGPGAFYGCSSLESINIPAGVTRIEKDALRETGLKSVEFHEGVTYFGDMAFRDCKQLKEVYIYAPEFTMESNTFGIMSGVKPAMTIYVVNAEMKAYVESKLTSDVKTYITVKAPATVTDKTSLQEAMAKAIKDGEKNIFIDGTNFSGDLNYGFSNANLPAGVTVTVRNAKVTATSKWNYLNGKLVFENCEFTAGLYSIHFDDNDGVGDVVFKNCKLVGWLPFAAINSVTFEGCHLTGNGSYALIRSYADLTLKNCVIDTTLANHTDGYTDGVQVIDATLIEENVTYIDNHTAYLQNVLKAGKHVVLSSDLTINEGEMMTAPYGNKMALSQNGGVFDGNDNSIAVTANGDNYVVMTNGGTIKNLDIDRGFRGIVLMSPKQDVYVDNVNIGVDDEVCYTINTAEGDGTHSLYVSNSVLNGWCSIGTAVKYVSFTDCTFGQGTYYTNVSGRLVKPYVDALFENCDFCNKCYIDLSAFVGTKVVVKNCTVNGVKITAENWTSLVAPEDTCGEGQISVELKNGTFLTAENVADYIVFE